MKEIAVIDHIRQWFQPAEAERVARQTGWLKRQGKIHPQDFLLSLTCGQMSALHLTLNAQAQSLPEPVTPQAVNERYSPAAVADVSA